MIFTVVVIITISENLQKIDVNTKDHSYQFYYRDYPTAPRPLLAAVWEIEHLELAKAFMELNPDTAVKYTFESEAASPPKPLFFQVKTEGNYVTVVLKLV